MNKCLSCDGSGADEREHNITWKEKSILELPKRKSMITGTGYGSNHCWSGYTPQDNSKRTIYTCEDCPASFVHHYDAVPDIFLAMQQAGVPESCGDQ